MKIRQTSLRKASGLAASSVNLKKPGSVLQDHDNERSPDADGKDRRDQPRYTKNKAASRATIDGSKGQSSNT